jgi:hypothetical protein
MGQQAAWLCPQQRIQAGKPLHLRLPSLLSEPRRNSAMAKVTAFMRRGIFEGEGRECVARALTRESETST